MPQGPKNNGDQAEQAMGRSLGRFTTKIHVPGDGLGNPLRLRLIPGQRSDIVVAEAMIKGLNFEYILADRGYAAPSFYDWILDQSYNQSFHRTKRQRRNVSMTSDCIVHNAAPNEK